MTGLSSDLSAMGRDRWPSGPLYMVVIWSLLLAISFVAARALVGRLSANEALSILRRRLAAGEIGEGEFEAARLALRR